MAIRNKNIGDVLIENEIITKDILAEALEHQTKFGGNITQYLVTCGYIKEEDMVKCISSQFGYPYLPLSEYDVPPEVIKLVPSELAEKYWLVPVDNIENLVTVVMANPLDEEAIREVEKVTKCKVQPFVGIRSDIAKAIARYYKITVEGMDMHKDKAKAPIFLHGTPPPDLEHRRSLRIKADMSIHFTVPGAPDGGEIEEVKTKDVARHGFLFESPNMLPIGSFVMLKIDLPHEESYHTISAVAQVVRVIPLENKKFDVAVKLVAIPEGDADKIVKHALSKSKRSEKEKK